MSKKNTDPELESVSAEIEGVDDVKIARMLCEGAAWLVAYTVERLRIQDREVALAAADEVADHFAKRYGPSAVDEASEVAP